MWLCNSCHAAWAEACGTDEIKAVDFGYFLHDVQPHQCDDPATCSCYAIPDGPHVMPEIATLNSIEATIQAADDIRSVSGSDIGRLIRFAVDYHIDQLPDVADAISDLNSRISWQNIVQLISVMRKALQSRVTH